MAADTRKEYKNWVIYEVYVRNHGPNGNFTDVEADLPRIRSMGADAVWFMPIHPIGVKGRKGTLGCPYSISDYHGVNPEYGTRAEVHGPRLDGRDQSEPSESVHAAFVNLRRFFGLTGLSDCELHSAFDMTYDYDLWPVQQAAMAGKIAAGRYLEMLRFQKSAQTDGRFVLLGDEPAVQAAWDRPGSGLYGVFNVNDREEGRVPVQLPDGDYQDALNDDEVRVHSGRIEMPESASILRFTDPVPLKSFHSLPMDYSHPLG